jgi:hypothetical protein
LTRSSAKSCGRRREFDLGEFIRNLDNAFSFRLGKHLRLLLHIDFVTTGTDGPRRYSCAHQVCNFSDCIKVASDFVSVENVGRCWKGTFPLLPLVATTI